MKKLLCLDLECSDIIPSSAEILQAALIEFDENYNEVERRVYKIRPRIWTAHADKATEIHGITREEAYTYPPYHESMRDLLSHLATFKNAHLVMHVNPIGGRYYDASVLRYHALDMGFYFEFYQAFPDNKFISTHSLCKRLNLPCKLDLASLHKYYFPLDSHKHHDAMADCEATFKIFKMINGLKLWRDYEAIRLDSPDSGEQGTQVRNSRRAPTSKRRTRSSSSAISANL